MLPLPDAPGVLPAPSPGNQALLAGLPVFRDVAPEQLARIAARALPVQLDKGEWLFRRGDRCTGFHVVRSGAIKVAFLSPQGVEKVVEIVRPAQSFGEALLFLARPCLVGARALAESTLLHITGRVLDEELARDPRLARSVLAALSRSLRALLDDEGSNVLSSGTERVIDYLLRGVAERGGAQMEVRLARKGAVASQLGMTPEHFSRTLGKLRAARLIEVRGGLVRLLDLERLRAYCDP